MRHKYIDRTTEVISVIRLSFAIIYFKINQIHICHLSYEIQSKAAERQTSDWKIYIYIIFWMCISMRKTLILSCHIFLDFFFLNFFVGKINKLRSVFLIPSIIKKLTSDIGNVMLPVVPIYKMVAFLKIYLKSHPHITMNL